MYERFCILKCNTKIGVLAIETAVFKFGTFNTLSRFPELQPLMAVFSACIQLQIEHNVRIEIYRRSPVGVLFRRQGCLKCPIHRSMNTILAKLKKCHL